MERIGLRLGVVKRGIGLASRSDAAEVCEIEDLFEGNTVGGELRSRVERCAQNLRLLFQMDKAILKGKRLGLHSVKRRTRRQSRDVEQPIHG